MEDKIDIIGRNIKRIRTDNNMTQKDLAYRLKVERPTLTHYEKGDRVPSIDILWNIADIFDISIDELVGRK